MNIYAALKGWIWGFICSNFENEVISEEGFVLKGMLIEFLLVVQQVGRFLILKKIFFNVRKEKMNFFSK